MTDGPPHKKPVMQSFDVIFDVGLHKVLNKYSRGQWFEMIGWMPNADIVSWFKVRVEVGCGGVGFGWRGGGGGSGVRGGRGK